MKYGDFEIKDEAFVALISIICLTVLFTQVISCAKEHDFKVLEERGVVSGQTK